MYKKRGKIKDLRDTITAVLLSVIVLLLGGYMVYDLYFRLPISPPSSADNGNIDSETEDNLFAEKFNILLLGLDGRAGLNDRSDVLILVTVDQKNKKAQLLSIPRDTRVKVRGTWDKINAAYAYGGIDLTKQTVSDFLGVQIDRYVIINFDGLVRLVDKIGGIYLDVPERMYKPLEGIDLQPGYQHLNGKEVLAYTRYRGTKGGDMDRSRRQQEVLQLLVEKVLAEKNIAQITELAELAKEDVQTDLTIREIVALARLASPVLENGLATKILPGKSKIIDNLWYWEPDLAKLEEALLVS